MCTTTNRTLETPEDSTEIDLDTAGDAALQLTEAVLGPAPNVSHDDGIWVAPWGATYELGPSDTYDWPGFQLWVQDRPPNGVASGCALTGPAPDSAIVTAAFGVHVGSTIEEIVAAGGTLEKSIAADTTRYGHEGPFERYTIDRRDVPNTESLASPGSVGSTFQIVTVKDGIAIGIESMNDFSDL